MNKALAIPEPVRKAIEHVRSLYPGVCMVVFNDMTRWHYMDDDFYAPKFGEDGQPSPDQSILEAAADAVPSFPAVYQLYASADNDNPAWEQPAPELPPLEDMLDLAVTAATGLLGPLDNHERVVMIARKELPALAQVPAADILRIFARGAASNFTGLCLALAMWNGSSKTAAEAVKKMNPVVSAVIEQMLVKLLDRQVLEKLARTAVQEEATKVLRAAVPWVRGEIEVFRVPTKGGDVSHGDRMLEASVEFIERMEKENHLYKCEGCGGYHLTDEATAAGLTVEKLEARFRAEKAAGNN